MRQVRPGIRPNLIAPSSAFRRVVVATDFSEGARSAAARLARLPLAPRAHIHLVHVVPVPTVVPIRDAKEMAAEQMARVAAAARRRWTQARVHVEVSAGRAADEIVAIARSVGAELIVAGRRGAGGFPKLLLGSTVERLARLSPMPVLIVAGGSGGHRHALFALDTADETIPVVAVGARLLSRAARVEVLHVYWAYGEGYLRFGGVSPRDVHRHRLNVRNTARAELARAAEVLAALGWEPELLIVNGEPRRMVPAFIRRRDPDLVVIGNHARNAVARALLGSVAQEVLRHAPCDVLLVPV